jgi:hypothetical protein
MALLFYFLKYFVAGLLATSLSNDYIIIIAFSFLILDNLNIYYETKKERKKLINKITLRRIDRVIKQERRYGKKIGARTHTAC